jgi:hypothetical protein
MTKRSYAARADGWVAGRRVLKGEVVEMTDAAAKYEPVDRFDPAMAALPVVIGIDLAAGPDVTVVAEVPPPSDPVEEIDMAPKPARRRKGAK